MDVREKARGERGTRRRETKSYFFTIANYPLPMGLHGWARRGRGSVTEYGSELGGRSGCIRCAVAHLPIDPRAMLIARDAERQERSEQLRAGLRYEVSNVLKS